MSSKPNGATHISTLQINPMYYRAINGEVFYWDEYVHEWHEACQLVSDLDDTTYFTEL